jgi:hypothetical protein
MKKLAMLLLALLLAAPFAFAQADATAPAAPAPAAEAAPADAAPAAEAAPATATFAKVESDHYSVVSEYGEERAAALSLQLEAYFGLYDAFARFDSSALKAKLNVREFKEKAGFDAYMTQVVGETKDDFVYLHYPNPERSELLVFYKEAAEFSASLAHQGFVQFLKAFVSSPPLWLREGAAVCFESARWDEARGALEFPENLSWLETVKALKDKGSLLPTDKLLSLGQQEASEQIDVFYPQAWAFVSFLANSEDKAFNRLLWDSVAALRKDAALEDNQAAVGRIIDTWYGADSVSEGFTAYLAERKTFPELVAEGVKLYSDKGYDQAKDSFEKAKTMDAGSYVPDYYLGLIAYAKNDFDGADALYKSALDLGCDPAITNYALGVNAYAQNRLDDAKTFLRTAKESSPDRYGEKADALIAKIGR